MFQLEVEVMIISLGTKSDFLDNNLGLFSLELFLLFLLLIEKLAVIDYFANWRISSW
jgi:hypothetical protein